MADALAPLICDRVGNTVWYRYGMVYMVVFSDPSPATYRSEAGLDSNHNEAPN